MKSQFWKSIMPFILLSLVKKHQITKDKRGIGLGLSYWKQLEVQLQTSSWLLTFLPHLESAQEFGPVWEWRQNIDTLNMGLKEHDAQLLLLLEKGNNPQRSRVAFPRPSAATCRARFVSQCCDFRSLSVPLHTVAAHPSLLRLCDRDGHP